MGRHAKVSTGKFKQTHRTSKSVQEIAEKLGIAVPTVYNWMSKLNLPAYNRQTRMTIEEQRKLITLFSGDITLARFQIAAKIRTQQSARSQLYNAVANVWIHDSPDIPLPENFIEIRVANHLYDFVKSKKRSRQAKDGLPKVIRAISSEKELSAVKTRQVRDYLERVRQQ